MQFSNSNVPHLPMIIWVFVLDFQWYLRWFQSYFCEKASEKKREKDAVFFSKSMAINERFQSFVVVGVLARVFLGFRKKLREIQRIT